MYNPFSPKSLNHKGLPEGEFYQLGELSLPIQRNARRKSLAVKQKGNQIYIDAPKKATKAQIERILEENLAWLLAQVDKYKVLLADKVVGNAGDSFELFGIDTPSFVQLKITWLPLYAWDKRMISPPSQVAPVVVNKG